MPDRVEGTGGQARPTLGVLMAVRDGRATVEASLRSVCEQTVAPDQVVVVDDGSTDGTVEVVAGLQERFPCIEVVASRPVGRAAARNQGLRQLRTDLVAVQDADDIAFPWRFEEALVTFARLPSADGVGAQMLGFRRTGAAWALPAWPVEPERIAALFAAGRMAIAHPTAVVRRAAMERAGGYDEGFAYAEDLALFRRISANGPLVSADRVVTLYRSPRRRALPHLLRTELATRRVQQPELPLRQRAAALAAVQRGWLRQRLRPLPPELPLDRFGIDSWPVAP